MITIKISCLFFCFNSGKELKNLPVQIRNIMKSSVKHKQIGQRKETINKKNKKTTTTTKTNKHVHG